MWLCCGDLHLTDQVRDDYRFKIFKWLAKQQQSLPVAATYLAGDITDAKNRHSATLVNRIVDGLRLLKPPVYICLGNHDYRDPDNPFFRFINHIEGLHFIVKPTLVTQTGLPQMGVIPHVRTQEEFDASVNKVSNPDCYLVHQTFEGAIAETGALLSGLRASPDRFCHPRLGVLAGDVHKPQRQGIVTYIGCPYHVRFGDGFNPRTLFIDRKGKRQNLYFDAPHKHSLTVSEADDIANNSNLADGDQVKLTVRLSREEAVEWKRIKAEILKACAEEGVDVYGCKLEVQKPKTKAQAVKRGTDGPSAFDQFCSTEKVAKAVKEVGIKLMERNHGN